MLSFSVHGKAELTNSSVSNFFVDIHVSVRCQVADRVVAYGYKSCSLAKIINTMCECGKRLSKLCHQVGKYLFTCLFCLAHIHFMMNHGSIPYPIFSLAAEVL